MHKTYAIAAICDNATKVFFTNPIVFTLPISDIIKIWLDAETTLN